MYITVLCALFVIITNNKCYGERVVNVNIFNEQTYICNATEEVVTIPGEGVLLNVTSSTFIEFGRCNTTEENNSAYIDLNTKTTSPNDRRFLFKFTPVITGAWKCEFYTHRNIIDKPDTKKIINNVTYSVVACDKLGISVGSFPETDPCGWTCIALTGGFLLLQLIFIILMTWALIYYKRKSRPVHDIESLSAMPRQLNDRARYSKAPLKKPLVTESERESIYEALDHLQLSAYSDLSALETLPRTPLPPKQTDYDSQSSCTSDDAILTDTKKKTKKKEKPKKDKKMSLPALEASKSEADVKIRSSFGKLKKKSKDDQKQKRTTIERIRERPPLPIPEPSSSEEYEVMSPQEPVKTPEPVKHKFKKPPKIVPTKPNKAENSLTNTVSPARGQKPLLKPEPAAVPVKLFVPPTKPNTDAVSELESILKKKGIGGRSESPDQAKGIPPKPNLLLVPDTGLSASMSTSRPKAKPALPPMPASIKPAPGTMVKPSPPTPIKPKPSPVPPPISTLPRPAAPVEASQTRTLRPTKPSPMDAPVPPPISTLPRPARKVPAEDPKPAVNLKPTIPTTMKAPEPPPISTLPRPTGATPAEETDEDDNEWGEDWSTYDALPDYNIYSM